MSSFVCWLVVYVIYFCWLFFFFKQKTAYEMRISDWSSDVCSSDLLPMAALFAGIAALRWALNGDAANRDRLLGYMGGLAGGAILFQFATRGPAGLAGAWCDSLSAPYLAAFPVAAAGKIGRASGLERVCQFV